MYPHHRHQRQKSPAAPGLAPDLGFWGPIIPLESNGSRCYHSFSYHNTTARLFNPVEGSVPSGHAPLVLSNPKCQQLVGQAGRYSMISIPEFSAVEPVVSWHTEPTHLHFPGHHACKPASMVFIHVQPSQTKMWSWPSHHSWIIIPGGCYSVVHVKRKVTREEGWEHYVPSPHPKPRSCLQLITICKEKLVFSNRVSLGIQITLKDRLNAQQLMVNTKQSQWYHWRVLVL